MAKNSKKHMRKFIFTILISKILTSCFGLFDSGSDTIVDDYKVSWIDIRETRSLNKGERLVPPYIYAVGYNSKYIYVKQHPLLKNTEEKIDRKITYYYIIYRTKNTYQDKPIIGPLGKIDFEKRCRELAIKDIEFDLTYPTNLYF